MWLARVISQHNCINIIPSLVTSSICSRLHRGWNLDCSPLFQKQYTWLHVMRRLHLFHDLQWWLAGQISSGTFCSLTVSLLAKFFLFFAPPTPRPLACLCCRAWTCCSASPRASAILERSPSAALTPFRLKDKKIAHWLHTNRPIDQLLTCIGYQSRLNCLLHPFFPQCEKSLFLYCLSQHISVVPLNVIMNIPCNIRQLEISTLAPKWCIAIWLFIWSSVALDPMQTIF